MTTPSKQETITTKIWKEIPEDDNPFAAKVCYCSGFDVYGDLLGKASYIEYLYLLFKLEPPSQNQAKLLEGLAIALANPGIRDHSVRGAMNAGVGGSTHASALMAALAVGAGSLGGGREVYAAIQYWEACGTNLNSWEEMIKNPPKEERVGVWQPIDHVPGFDPHGVSCTLPIRQTLAYLVKVSESKKLEWLQSNRVNLEKLSGRPLAMSGIATAVFYELGLSPDQAEMFFLFLRLPGAAVHALEQEELGWRRYPFFGDGLNLTNDPGPVQNNRADT